MCFLLINCSCCLLVLTVQTGHVMIHTCRQVLVIKTIYI